MTLHDRRRAALPVLLWVLAACGSRSGLRVEGEPIDAGTRVGLWTECAVEGVPVTRAGEPRMLRVSVEGASASEALWSVVSGPPGASLDPVEGERTRFTATEPGTYRVRAEVGSGPRSMAQCTVEIDVVPDLGLYCGGGVHRGEVGETLVLSTTVIGPPPTAIDWTLVESPGGAGTDLRPSGAMARFRGDAPGAYRIRVSARGGDGAMAECVHTVELGVPPPVVCPEERLLTVTGTPVPLAVSAAPSDASVRWSVEDRPAGSAAVPNPSAGPATTVVPDRAGTYRIRARVTTDDGLSAECLTQILAAPAPPSLTCPGVVVTRPLDATTLRVGVTGAGSGLRYFWSLVDRPRGSRAELRDREAESARLTPDLAGEYRLRVEVSDSTGWAASCEVVVRAEGLEGLRVEMFWDTDGSDMDLHLLHPDATEWYGELDCYFRNCQEPDGLPWGAAGTADNPRLAIDERFGFGPENTNIEVPEPGFYRVAVTAFDDGGDVEVRVYCGSTEPVAELGPVALDASSAQFWRAADVEVLSTGGCRVHPLGDGRPDIITENTARRER